MIPINAKYDNNKQSAYAKSYSSNIIPQQAGPYVQGSTINIHIPCTQNTVLSPSESFLKFKLTATNGTGAAAYMRLGAAGAHGCIKRIRVWHGSNLIEDLDEYGLIVGKMMCYQQSGDSFAGKMNLMSGTSNDYHVQVPTLVATDITVAAAGNPTDAELAAAINLYAPKKVKRIIAGERLWNAAAANEFTAIASAGETTARVYTINLFSILGSLSSKYLPVFALSQSGSPIRLEIQLHDNANKFINSPIAFSTTSQNFRLEDVEYVASYVELGDEAMSVVQQHAGDQLKFVTTGWRNYGYTATRTSGTADEIQIAVPAKFSSLKALYLVQREKASGAITYHANDSCHAALSEYNVRLGSRVVPSKAPNTKPAMFCNVLQALGSLSDVNHEPAIDMYNYDVLEPTANTETAEIVNFTASESQFMIGLDLESYSGAKPTDVFQGYNSSTEDVHWVLKYATTALSGGGAHSIKFDTFAQYDQVIVIENGEMREVH